MSAHDGAIDHVDIPLDLAGMICTFMHSGEQLCPEALLLPSVEPRTHCLPIAVAFGQITPGTPGAFDPEDTVQHGAVI